MLLLNIGNMHLILYKDNNYIPDYQIYMFHVKHFLAWFSTTYKTNQKYL